MRIGLVGCVKTKLGYAAPAQDLYTSALFRGRRAFVTGSCDGWYILSAKHGLVAPADVLEPYEDSLKGKSAAAKRTWAASVLRAVETTDLQIADSTFEIHAGAEYRNFGLADGLISRGATVEVPAEHMSQGEQLSFYAKPHPTPPRSTTRAVLTREQPLAARISYAPLAARLTSADNRVEKLSFSAIERILGRPLPASARRHRAWWSNESAGTHSHAGAWMGVGWLVEAVDFNSGTVEFRRGHR